MAAPQSFGPSRSGLYEVTKNANAVDEQSVPLLLSGDPVTAVTINEGGFATIVGGFAQPVGGTTPKTAYPNVIGFERTDVVGSRTTTLAFGAGFWLKTTEYGDTGLTDDDFPEGTELTVKNAKVRPAVSGDVIFAIVVTAPSLYQSDGQRALQRAGRKVVEIEWGPRGHKP